MVRLSALPAVLALALVLPAVAQAQPRPDPRREAAALNNGRPGVTPQPGQPVNAPGQPGGHRSPRDSDNRYRELQQQKREKMNDNDRRELSELEARQKRIDEMKRRDAERDRDRAERIRKAHQAQAAQFKSPPSAASLEEYRRYAQRKAALQRAKEIADAEGRTDASARAASLLSLEEQRHSVWVGAHAG